MSVSINKVDPKNFAYGVYHLIDVHTGQIRRTRDLDMLQEEEEDYMKLAEAGIVELPFVHWDPKHRAVYASYGRGRWWATAKLNSNKDIISYADNSGYWEEVYYEKALNVYGEEKTVERYRNSIDNNRPENVRILQSLMMTHLIRLGVFE